MRGAVHANAHPRTSFIRLAPALETPMRTPRSLLLAASLSFTISAPLAAQSGQLAQASGDFTMALTGDAIITRRLSPYEEPEFLDMIELIRNADVAFTNLEVLFHDFEPYPAHQSGGMWMRADPEIAGELVWAGIDMVARANNHAGDWGAEGLRLTTRHVEEAGLVHAGVGESLQEAREARFLETAKARVALVSMSSTFPDHSRAGRTRGDHPARPGLSPLRHSSVRIAPAASLDRLRSLLDNMQPPYSQNGNLLNALGTTFEPGPEPGERTTPNAQDMAEIAAVVNNASRQADYVIVTIHAHESAGSREVPAEFVVTFARAMIDAGASVFVGHGPHVLRGIEMYRGKPIFYSLGDFVFQNETLLRLPSENYERFDLGGDHHVADFNDARYDMDRSGFPANPEIWEAVVALPRFRGQELVDVRLHPISLGFGEERWVRGRPVFADEQLGAKILGDLIVRSEPFGTRIDIEDGIGVIRPAGAAASQSRR